MNYTRANRGEGVWLTKDQRDAIKIAMIKKEIRFKELAQCCGVSLGCLSPMVNGKIAISARVRRGVKNILDIEI